MGHASSTVTLMNMVRLGNKKVLESYNCQNFRKAAISVTEVTTMKPPHPKQCFYGEGALDLVFGGPMGGGGFNLSELFGERQENRMTTLAQPEMVVGRLTYLLGSDPQFTPEMGKMMLAKMLEDLNSVPPRKEEYQSAIGLAFLFDRCGGRMTKPRSDGIAKVSLEGAHHQRFVTEIRTV